MLRIRCPLVRCTLLHTTIVKAMYALCSRAAAVLIILGFLQDLRDSVRALKEDPNCVKDGKAPVYGMANINPDRSMVGEILVAVQDNLLD